MKNKSGLTQRAPDGWESARFRAGCVASSWFRQNGVVSSRPPAGNAHRWAALAKFWEMAEKANHLSENLYSIFHELLVPLNALVGTLSVLNNKVPKTLEEPLNLARQISNQLHTEVMAVFREPGNKIDLQSTDVASEQLRFLSGKWMKDLERLSEVVSQIDTRDVHLEDDLLNKILNGVVSKKGLDKLGEMLSHLTQVQAEHLMVDDGFFYVLHLKK